MYFTFLDPVWERVLIDHVRTAQPDANGNCDNVALVQASWIVLLADCPGFKKPDKVLQKFFNRIRRDYHTTLADAGKLAGLLRNSVSHDANGVRTKTSLHKEFGRWPIFREYKKWYDTDDDRMWFYLLTFLSWGRKAEFVDPTLEEASLTRWKEIESRLCRIDPPDHLLDDLQFILSHLPNPDYRLFSPKFGQKKVSEPEIKVYSDKLSLRYHPCVEEILNNVSSDDIPIRLQRLVIADPKLWEKGRIDKQHASIDYDWWDTVPKDRFSVRGISKVPNTLMYAQQGVLNMLLSAIGKSPFGKIINISNQKRNADKAQLSSVMNDYDTLDNKDASDSVSNRVVKRIFPFGWNFLFQSTRSSRVRLPNGRIKTVEKFAPMGSALCFPVQTLIFTAVCCLARFIVSQGCDAKTYLARGAIMVDRLILDKDTCVYGDDIICPSSDSTVIISLLETLGFTINVKKSFFAPSSFRESCGMEALYGTDVTPILFKVKGLKTQSLEYVDGLIDLCNRLYVADLKSTHAFLAGYLPKMFFLEVVFDGALPLQPYELLSDEPDNDSRLPKLRWNDDLQRVEVRLKVFRVPVTPLNTKLVVKDKRSERYQYASFLMRPSSSSSTDGGEGPKPPIGDVEQPTVRSVWVAA
jgi:hypothetical protein